MLGFVTKPIGLKGDFLIKIDADNPEKYYSLKYAFFRIPHGNDELIPFFFTHCTSHKSHLIRVTAEHITTPEEAARLRGIEVFLPLTLLPEREGNKFYYHEIIGFKLIEVRYGSLGEVHQIIEYPGQSLIQAFVYGKEVLIPLTEKFIKKVDRKNKVIYIDIPEGLIEI